MPDPMRIRATAQPDGGVDVRVLMSHEMETGQRATARASWCRRTSFPP